jgi:hypothetical protein
MSLRKSVYRRDYIRNFPVCFCREDASVCMITDPCLPAERFSQRLLWECLERGIPLMSGPRFPERESFSSWILRENRGPLFFLFLVQFPVFLITKKSFNHGGHEEHRGFVIFLPWCAFRPRGFFFILLWPLQESYGNAEPSDRQYPAWS